ncbi:OsmC family protein [Bacillus massiliigorillae]|uniref:OsmC family protein n=1 Tax=Bacillus massiliigorillae TaxID=1243664 RepID=UPI0003A36F42|nr:OsmC family protein [Bacillus massiliigorillae]
MAVQTFKVKTTLKEGVLVETEARGHKVIVDEPKSLGGTDKGMNPVELILAGLGACQSIVARTYAKKFDIEFEDFWIELEGDLDTDGFLNKSDVRPGYSTVRYTIHIQSDAPEEKIEEFIKFVEAHCPVGDTFANVVDLVSAGVVVESTVK